MYAHKGSHSCLGGVTYALGANDWGVTGAWESFVPLTPVVTLLIIRHLCISVGNLQFNRYLFRQDVALIIFILPNF